jgi:hypothetical protein
MRAMCQPILYTMFYLYCSKWSASGERKDAWGIVPIDQLGGSAFWLAQPTSHGSVKQ